MMIKDQKTEDDFSFIDQVIKDEDFEFIDKAIDNDFSFIDKKLSGIFDLEQNED